MFLQAEIYVFEDKKTILGFVGMKDNYIAGIFVSNHVRSHGIGKLLLDYVKQKKESLYLSVYRKNTRAIHFYQKEGFHIQCEKQDQDSGEKEYVMTWNSNKKKC